MPDYSSKRTTECHRKPKTTTIKVSQLRQKGLFVNEIAKTLGVSRSTVYIHLREAQLCEDRSIAADEGKIIILDYQSGKSTEQIASEKGRSARTIVYWLKNNGITLRNSSERSRKYSLREDVFANAEQNLEAAYWIGFLMADGCILHHSIRLKLSAKDKNHLVKFKKFLGSNSSLEVNLVSSKQLSLLNRKNLGKKYYEMATLKANSKRLVEDLARYGVLPRKSQTAEVHVLENNADFWRGCIDGDGTLYIGKEGYPTVRLVGSKPLVQQFANFVAINNQNRRPTVRSARNIWQANVNGKDAVKITKLLYKNQTPSLDRKLVLAKIIMQWKGKGRRKGEAHHNAKLTGQKVKEIREKLDLGISSYEIAKQYGVDFTTIGQIKRHVTWNHVD